MIIPLLIKNTEAGNTIFQQAKEQIPEFDKSFIDSVENDLMRNIRPDASFGMLLRSRLTNAVSIIRVVLNQHLGALVSYKLLSEKRLGGGKPATQSHNQALMKFFLDNLVSLMESRHISDHAKFGLEMESCQDVKLIPEQRYDESLVASTVRIHENTQPDLASTLPAEQHLHFGSEQITDSADNNSRMLSDTESRLKENLEPTSKNEHDRQIARNEDNPEYHVLPEQQSEVNQPESAYNPHFSIEKLHILTII
jgi:hypothetical protein